MDDVVASREDRARVWQESRAHGNCNRCEALLNVIIRYRCMNAYMDPTSRRGIRSSSSSFSFAHLPVRGGIKIST